MRNISELLTNLIPYPRMHFPLITHAPITNNANSISSASTELATMSFDRNYQMIKVDPKLGKYLSVCMMFRGDLKPTEINTTIAFVQREQSIPVTQNMNSPLFKVRVVTFNFNYMYFIFNYIFLVWFMLSTSCQCAT